jgi:hypothetical protein
MFALDAFAPQLSVWQQIIAFLIHLIPSFILLLILVIAWRWEKIGGIVFISLGLIFTPFIFSTNYKHNHSIWLSISIILMITIPFIIVGILFLLSYSKKKKGLSNQ